MKFADEVSLAVEFCGFKMPNPFILSSAPPTGTGDMIRVAFRAGWGGAVTKTIGMDKDIGPNVTPRLHHLSFPGKADEPKKLYGLQNIELITDRKLEIWLNEIQMITKEFPDRLLIASIMAGGDDKESWQTLAKSCELNGAKMLELNFSCPHGMPEKGMGAAVGQNPEVCKTVTSWVKEVTKIPVMPKMTPNITDITAPALASIEGGADAISAINTVGAVMGIDLKTLNPFPDVGGYSTPGGYSGPAIKPIGLKAVSSLYNSINVPISGMGGIENWKDAAEYILLGARTVQLCTAVMFHGFSIIEELNDGLTGFLEDHGFQSLDDCVGLSAKKITDHVKLDRNIKKISSFNHKTCIKCDLCYISCRDAGYQAIAVNEERYPVVDTARCTGCSLCEQVCPVWDCVKLVTA
ncbi:MAG: NAD-dependent dihydropyrimidine dehydrogenase subunit PreA [candidate division Zixibacteria bacterium]|nr:NAD-dependent dihydropyrimidine dehydrogenase subunit PreA [candidate division Zixibacteria bacterium]